MPNDSESTAARIPVVGIGFVRGLARAVALSVLVAAAVSAGVVIAKGESQWWPAFGAAAVIGAMGAAASCLVLSKAAGKTVDWLVTFVMAATVIRMGVCLIGLLVCVYGLHTAPAPTAAMLGGYYAATLVAETWLLMTAAGPQSPDNNKISKPISSGVGHV